jgi:hypothetical protein
MRICCESSEKRRKRYEKKMAMQMERDMKHLEDNSDEKKIQRIQYLWKVARRELFLVSFLKR